MYLGQSSFGFLKLFLLISAYLGHETDNTLSILMNFSGSALQDFSVSSDWKTNKAFIEQCKYL